MEKLPYELLDQIVGLLVVQDGLGLRSACRYLNIGLQHWFEALFQHARFAYNPRGLSSMLTVSRHPKISGLVENLTISYKRWDHDLLHAGTSIIISERERNDPPLEGVSIEPPATDEIDLQRKFNVLCNQLLDQWKMISRGQDAKLLANTLHKLPNCHTIHLIEDSDHHCWRRDEWSKNYFCGGRYDRLILQEAWVRLGTSIGSMTRQRGLTRLQKIERHGMFSDMLLRALALNEQHQQSSATLRTLNTTITDFEFLHPLKFPIDDSFASQLRNISLVFNASPNDARSHRDNDRSDLRFGDGFTPEIPWTRIRYVRSSQNTSHWLSNFAKKVPLLEALSLDFPFSDVARLIAPLAFRVTFPRLKSFKVRGKCLDLREDYFWSKFYVFVQRHKETLKCLDISNVKTGQKWYGHGGAILYTTPYFIKHVLLICRGLEDVRLDKFTESRFTSVEAGESYQTVNWYTEKDGPGESWACSGTAEEVRTALLSLQSHLQ